VIDKAKQDFALLSLLRYKIFKNDSKKCEFSSESTAQLAN